MFLIHASLIWHTLPPLEWLAIRPLMAVDFSLHFYEALNVRSHLDSAHAVWGYNPHWLAGYPEGVLGLLDNKLFFLALTCAPPGWEVVIFNSTVIALIVLSPLVLALAARRAGCPAAPVIGWATSVFFAVPVANHLWFAGTGSFVFSALLSVAVVVEVARALVDERFWRSAPVALALAFFASLVHPGALIIVAPALALAFWRSALSFGRRVARSAAFAIALSLPNLPLFAAIALLGSQVSPFPAGPLLQGGFHRFVDDWFATLLRTRPGWDGGAGALFAIVVASLAARLDRECSEQRGSWNAVSGPLLASASACFALAYAASWFPGTRELQPYRFLIPLSFLLCVPASRGLAALVTERRRGGAAAALVLVVIAVVTGQAALSVVRSSVLGVGDDPAETQLVDFLQKQTSPEERVIVETPYVSQPSYPGSERSIDGQRFRLLPVRVAREFIGNGAFSATTRHRYATFSNGKILGRRLDAFTPEDLEGTLVRYAVGWIVAFEPKTLETLRKFPDTITEVARLSDLFVFRVQHPQCSRLLQGEGRVVSATLDRIEVEGARGERLVLKYHWVPTLVTDPPLRIEEARLPGMPVGFIAVYPEGRSRFTIRNRGAPW